MNLVDYSSSSDEEERKEEPEQAKTLPESTNLSGNSKKKSIEKSADEKPKKKSKKLDISFLPTEIQRALIRKQSKNESGSDSDDEYVSARAATNLSSSKRSNLMAVLPPPKVTSDSRITGIQIDKSSIPIDRAPVRNISNVGNKTTLTPETSQDNDIIEEVSVSKLSFPSASSA